MKKHNKCFLCYNIAVVIMITKLTLRIHFSVSRLPRFHSQKYVIHDIYYFLNQVLGMPEAEKSFKKVYYVIMTQL
jgi:hypothetical protein